MKIVRIEIPLWLVLLALCVLSSLPLYFCGRVK